jgi:DNA repair exonuclease SbcCD nuclease subunit
MNGHYHRAQVHAGEHGVTVHIPGSLARLTFSEEKNAPGYMLLEV